MLRKMPPRRLSLVTIRPLSLWAAVLPRLRSLSWLRISDVQLCKLSLRDPLVRVGFTVSRIQSVATTLDDAAAGISRGTVRSSLAMPATRSWITADMHARGLCAIPSWCRATRVNPDHG